MNTVKSRRKIPVASSETTTDSDDKFDQLLLSTVIQNNEDLSPFIRKTFATGKPETLLHLLRHFCRSKESEIEEVCKVHYQYFILAVDDLRSLLSGVETVFPIVIGSCNRCSYTWLVLKNSNRSKYHTHKQNWTQFQLWSSRPPLTVSVRMAMNGLIDGTMMVIWGLLAERWWWFGVCWRNDDGDLGDTVCNCVCVWERLGGFKDFS